nr:MAG TPA: hypothetical protein [Inoviridae sp.]
MVLLLVLAKIIHDRLSSFVIILSLRIEINLSFFSDSFSNL